ncbi:4-hydroxy-tetrahydrodipicolinate synthase [Paenibacillus silvisoli]|uniref:4-hydroxy-tetrahydrodipicolinate synthase n=1 Tax=Paenibacillus silvisoli TaxID=3110539 RepID=UPI002803C516|nr:4-hydroxy-tetrahydrodipicolinate synthase [Paenibacillus silvisoli]
MLTERDLRGTFVPVVTPFLTTEELDTASYRRYLERLLQHDIQGLAINGTTGEAPTVGWEEVEWLVSETRNLMSTLERRLPIIVGTGTNNTASTVSRTEAAGKLGADAVLIVTPYYSRPSQEGVLAHFRRAAETGIPVIAYEVPSRTGMQLELETVRRIMELDGVIGLKDSTSSLRLISELRRSCTKPILCGNDPSYLGMLEHGASGGILASANVRTDDYVQLFRYFTAGQHEPAAKLFQTLLPLIEHLFEESNPAPLKWALAQQKLIDSPALRLPMTPISAGLSAKLMQLLPAPQI